MSAPEIVETAIDLSSDQQNGYHSVSEGYLAVAAFSDIPGLFTYGLYVCKGITIYNPKEQTGLLAHLSQSQDFDASLQSILDGYQSDLSGADVHVVHAQEASLRPYWPSLEKVTSFFLDHNPRSLTVDANQADRYSRAIKLNLENGEVSEIDNPYSGHWVKRPAATSTLIA